MNTHQLWFTAPLQVELREQALPALPPGRVLVKNLYSALSAGTEMLVYRGQLPASMALDASLEAYGDRGVSYPLQYGYACVGQVEQAGEGVDPAWLGRAVFSFRPHASHCHCAVDELIAVPEDIDPQAAVFLANMETAVNLVQDGNPGLGERVVVIGQGIVGLLVSGVLTQYPLAGLYAVDSMESRRSLSAGIGVDQVFTPEDTALKERLGAGEHHVGADLLFELSGSPAALNLAVDLCGYNGRIVVGSWYGSKRAEINLGEQFHRNRISIVSSQVSTIAPELSGRWNKARRFSLAWDMIRRCRPEQFVTHRLPFQSATEAYRLLDESPEQAVQVIFDYQA